MIVFHSYMQMKMAAAFKNSQPTPKLNNGIPFKPENNRPSNTQNANTTQTSKTRL